MGAYAQIAQRYAIWASIGIAAVFSFWDLGSDVLEDYDEATYAIVIEDTLASGNILTLRFGEDPWFDKPPLYFWLSIGASSLFGDTPFAYRFFSALAIVLDVAFTTLLVRALTGDNRAAAIAGLTLATTAGFIEAGRQARLDVPVTAAVLFTCYAFVRGMQNHRWLTGTGIGTGIGIMTKSVIGLLSAPFVLTWSIANRNLSWLVSRYTYLGLTLGLCIAAPWHIYEYQKYGDWFWQMYFKLHVVDRYSENILGGTASNDALLSFFLQAASPWHLVFILLLGFLWGFRNTGLIRTSLPLLASVAAVLIVFLTAGTKIGYYLVPAFPFAAAFIGIMGSALYDRARALHRSFLVALFTGILILAAAHTITLSFNYTDPYETNQRIAQEEKAAGLAMAAVRASEPVYISDWQYRETLRYYSGVRNVRDVTERQESDQEFFLILPREHYERGDFPESRATPIVVYDGADIMVLRFP